MGSISGIDAAGVTAWFEQHVASAVPPLRFEQVSGGHSNLTYRVEDAEGQRFVLRRPPMKEVLATAHDMGREHKIISALWNTAVPVPYTYGHCDDTQVSGAPFYVMEHVDGAILYDLETAERDFDEPARRNAGASVVDTLADLHAVDVDVVGLGDLGRREDYIARQLHRWSKQYKQARTRELPDIERVRDELAASIPEQGPATVVHGDYKLGNFVHACSGEVAAVLDWEICTLGDPLADLGFLVATWADRQERDPRFGAASSALGFPSSGEIIERYAVRSGRDVSDIEYYVAFSAWRMACIVEGVYSRYLAGALGEPPPEASRFADVAAAYARRAAQALDARA